MAHLTGDYNCIHLLDCYARRFGYRRAFHHPQLIVAQCLTRLAPAEDWPRKLELWLRGPIPYGAALHLALSVARRESFSRCTSMQTAARRLSAAFVVVTKRRRIEAERLLSRQPGTPAEARA